MDRKPEPEYMDLPEEAEAYARADFSEVNELFARVLFDFVRMERCLALDIGTGPGDIPLRLCRRRPQWRIVGLDASLAMLSIARQSSLSMSHLVWLQGDAKRLPFSDGGFEVVFSNSILHHITDTDVFWSELKRVGKSGATVFLRDLARPADERRARQIVAHHAGAESSLLQEEYYRSLLSAYTPEEVCRQLAHAGLTALTVTMASDRHLDVRGCLP